MAIDTDVLEESGPTFEHRAIDTLPKEQDASRRGLPARASRRPIVPSPTALGWLSVGLAAAACLAPKAVGELTGLGNRSSLLRWVGLRELATGVGLLALEQKTPWLLARVAGDVMDLAILLSAGAPGRPRRIRALATLGVVGALTATDLAACGRSAVSGGAVAEGPLAAAIVVNKPPQECYEFWRHPPNLPKFMHLIESVNPIDDRRARWSVRGAKGLKFEWNVELSTDEPSRRLAWRAREQSGMQHNGVVRFESTKGVRGTLVRLFTQYHAAGGSPAGNIRRLFGTDPQSVLREDLRRFKQLIEAGEIPSTRGQPSGRRSLLGRLIPEGRLSPEGERP